MCSIVFNFLNNIFNTYLDVHTRIILNNVLKVTLHIVENAPPQTSSYARINYEFIHNLGILGSETFHVLLENRAWRILSRPLGILF